MNFYDEDEENQGLNPDQKAMLNKSLMEKYAAAGDDSEVKAAEGDASRAKWAGIIGQALSERAAVGARARGINVPSSAAAFDAIRTGGEKDLARAQQARKDKMGNVLAQDEMEWRGKERDRKSTDWAREDAQRGSEDDPNSPESKNAQALAKKLMPQGSFEGMSATKLKASLPHLEKMYGAEQQRLGRIDTINAQNAARADAKDDRDFRREEDRKYKQGLQDEKLSVGEYGQARTEDDAKKIKTAVELKANFDRKLQEMISLREGKGAEVWDRESVGRGQQLSNDLKVLYKDLANLGVLSKSDENIIDAVVPKDPLEWNASSMIGQDPTMVRLKGLKNDVNNDFATTLKNRLKRPSPQSESLITNMKDFQVDPGQGAGEAYADQGKKTAVSKQYSPSRNKTKITYSDGSEELVDGKQ